MLFIYLKYIAQVIYIGLIWDVALIQILMNNKVTCPTLTGKIFWVLISTNELCMQRQNGVHLFILPLLCLDFSGCVQSSVYFFLSCTPTNYIMLLGIFKRRTDTALLTDGRSAYKAKVGRWHLGGKILNLASGVELVHLHSDIHSMHPTTI